ncbi:hypothetical protein NMY22_g11193 [Coprinellus aureogranulatus]|nr:hypothetical protein NMY22_g11193 [Coprinellus aureogranulatus]
MASRIPCTRFPRIRTLPFPLLELSTSTKQRSIFTPTSRLFQTLLATLLGRALLSATSTIGGEGTLGPETDGIDDETRRTLTGSSNSRRRNPLSRFNSRVPKPIPRDATLDSVPSRSSGCDLVRPSEEASVGGESSPNEALFTLEDLLDEETGGNSTNVPKARRTSSHYEYEPDSSGQTRSQSSQAHQTGSLDDTGKPTSNSSPPTRQSSDNSIDSQKSIPTPPCSRDGTPNFHYQGDSVMRRARRNRSEEDNPSPAVTTLHYPEQEDDAKEGDVDETLRVEERVASPASTIATELIDSPGPIRGELVDSAPATPNDGAEAREPAPPAMQVFVSPRSQTHSNIYNRPFTYKVLRIHGSQCLVKILASFSKPRSQIKRVSCKVVTQFNAYNGEDSGDWNAEDLEAVPTIASNTYYPSNEVGSHIVFTLHRRGPYGIPSAIECIARIEQILSPITALDITETFRYVFKEPSDGDIYIENDQSGATAFKVYSIIGAKVDRYSGGGLDMLRSLATGKVAGKRRQNGLVRYDERRPYRIVYCMPAKHKESDEEFRDTLKDCLESDIARSRRASEVTELRSLLGKPEKQQAEVDTDGGLAKAGDVKDAKERAPPTSGKGKAPPLRSWNHCEKLGQWESIGQGKVGKVSKGKERLEEEGSEQEQGASVMRAHWESGGLP